MAYIGREPTVGNFQVCDAISVVNGQAAYTMQVSSVNVSPETANHMLVSLNGVLQAPTSSYTVSGSTITFASNLVTGDVINFIHILGSVLDLGVPSDRTVSLAKLASGTDGNIISYDTSGNPVAVATGSSGQVLTSAGAGAVPTFADLPAGGLYTKTATASLTSAASSITLQNAFNSTYTNYMITIESLIFAAASTNLHFIPIDSSGNATSVHKYAAEGYYANGAQSWRTNSAHAYANISNDVSSGTSQNCNGTIHIFSPMDTTAGITSYNWFLKSSKAYEEAGIVYGAGVSSAGVAYTGFKLQMSANNITSCKIACYGITNPS